MISEQVLFTLLLIGSLLLVSTSTSPIDTHCQSVSVLLIIITYDYSTSSKLN